MDGVAIVRRVTARDAPAAEWTRNARRESVPMSSLFDIFLLCPRLGVGQGTRQDVGEPRLRSHIDDIAVGDDEPIEIPRQDTKATRLECARIVAGKTPYAARRQTTAGAGAP